MLSYIHAFHAGNHGDIIKHLTLSITLQHLLKKDKPFTVIDTHSASGRYELSDQRLLKTGEAACGIQKLISFIESANSEIKDLEYIKICKSYIKKNLYPGSPEIERCFMRKNDELILNELHPQIINDLRSNMKQPLEIEKSDVPQVFIHNRNAREMLNAVLPPHIKRGCVIIDPSYEDSEDFSETTDMFLSAYKKWNTPVYLIWYPLLQHRSSELQHMKEVIEAAVERANSGNEDQKFLTLELSVKSPEEMTGLAQLYGSGMIVVNPPFGLKDKMEQLIPEIESILKS